ncbi:hypothetical protein EI165_14470 [Pseudoalteromonas nigrifaciens]|nr:hypothetical protein [Pseudoalteromonas nigrifaciens]
MVSLLLTNKKQDYFNCIALLHIIFLMVLYVVIDVFVIDYSIDENAFSKGFYSKLVLCILYLIGSKDKPLIVQEHKPIDAAFHFSVFALCLWMGVLSFALDSVTISRFVGIFLIFGGLSGFNLIDETLKIVRLKVNENSFGLLFTEITLKIFLFSIFCLAAFFLIAGEWIWDIKPFYEW